MTMIYIFLFYICDKKNTIMRKKFANTGNGFYQVHKYCIVYIASKHITLKIKH